MGRTESKSGPRQELTGAAFCGTLQVTSVRLYRRGDWPREAVPLGPWPSGRTAIASEGFKFER